MSEGIVVMRRVDVPDHASAVIVGGGVIGTSIAFHLAEAGVDGVVLLERGQLASGSTSKAAGGVRAQFSDELNIEIAKRSLAAFEDFARRPGWEIDFHQVGYLFVLTRESDCEAFERNVRLQQSLGVPSQMLTPSQVESLSPLTAVDDVLGGAFCPSDGHLSSESVVHGYAFAARKCGATIVSYCDVTDIEHRGDGIAAVMTNRGRVETDTVICAAGAWSSGLAQMAGVALPVQPRRRQVLLTEPIQDLPPQIPMTIDFERNFYFHREGPGLLMGMSLDSDPVTFDVQSTDDWIPSLIEAAERRAPSIASAGIQGGWAGLYEESPDHNALIGESQRVTRFLYATGFSGHGLLQAPAVGELVRDLYLGRTPFIDATPLSADRFEHGVERPEMYVV